MITSISNNQNNRTFGACFAKNGQTIEKFEEIGHLMNVGLQATVKGFEFDEARDGFYRFKPALNCNNPNVYLSENRDCILIEHSADDAMLITNIDEDTPEQKDFFQQTGWKLFSLVPRKIIDSVTQAKERDFVGDIKRKMCISATYKKEEKEAKEEQRRQEIKSEARTLKILRNNYLKGMGPEMDSSANNAIYWF